MVTNMRFEFENSDIEDRRKRLDAGDNDPRVSVSAIGEYIFCTRAGLLSQERQAKDRGEEEPTFDSLPRYEREAIMDALSSKCKWWMIGLVFFVITAVASVWLTPDHGAWRIIVVVTAAAALLALAYFIVGQTSDVVVLLRRRHDAFAGVAREFDFDDGEIHPVVWWDFFESGFESQKPLPMLDEKWKLDGKPFRVLIRGSEYIPVFKAKKAHERPKPQHIAKIMAYCHLILATQDRVSPFGVILYGNSYEGVAVPNHDRFRTRFHNALVAVREMVKALEDGPPPGIPNNTAKCAKCPWGRPRRVEKLQATMQDGRELDPNILWSNHGKRYHCDCGDRFEWIPPHERSKELGLHQ